jgi:hypothetical protein
MVHQLGEDSTTEDARRQSALLRWVVIFITLDAIKVLMNRDPYFWGSAPRYPQPFPFSYLAFSPLLAVCPEIKLFD